MAQLYKVDKEEPKAIKLCKKVGILVIIIRPG